MFVSLRYVSVLLASAVLTFAAEKHRAHSSVQLEESLVKSCKFFIGGHHFDLCPLFEGDWHSRYKTLEWMESTPPTVTRTVYKMALGGPLRVNKTLPEHEQCPEGTWVCKTVINRHPGRESDDNRILQVVPVAGDLSKKHNHAKGGAKYDSFAIHAQFGQSWSQRDEEDLPPLWIRMDGGRYVGENQRMLINFRCNGTVEDTEPTYGFTYKGTHFFAWSTPRACSHLHQKPASEHPAPPEGIEDPENLMPGEIDQSSVYSITSIILTVIASILLLAYIIMHPPPIIRRFVTPIIAPVVTPVARRLRRSRYNTFQAIGESKLLRWAKEDLAELGDEDEMVNGASLGEEIPLTPSPRNSKGSVTDYGSARY